MEFFGPLSIGILLGSICTYFWFKSKDFTPGGIVKDENIKNENPFEQKLNSLHRANIEFRKELDDLKIMRAPKAPNDDREKIFEIMKMFDSRLDEISKKCGALENDYRNNRNYITSEFNKFTYGIGKEFLEHIKKTQDKLDGLNQFNRHYHHEREKKSKNQINEVSA